jgi:hypothetical protein
VSPDIVVVGAVVVAFVGLVAYALYGKGDVSAEISHGATVFRLEAKDRVRGKSTLPRHAELPVRAASAESGGRGVRDRGRGA